MSMKTVFVVGAAVVMSATLNAQAQKPQPVPQSSSVKPAQSQQGARGGAPRDFNRLGLDFFYRAPLEGKVVKGAPYSADLETESVQTLGDGNRIVYRSTGRVYRDAEGRVRREEKNGSIETITITDPVANKSFTLDPATRTASQTLGFGLFSFYLDGLQMSLGRFEYGYRPTPGVVISHGAQNDYAIALGRGARGGRTRDGRDEYVEEQLPNRTIEGVVASGIRKTTTIPQGAIGNEQPIKTVSEEWTSVDLQVLVLTDVNDPRNGRTTYRLTNINRGDPDPALFKVPADYTIRLALRQKK
jgi:hypothetical protein